MDYDNGIRNCSKCGKQLIPDIYYDDLEYHCKNCTTTYGQSNVNFKTTQENLPYFIYNDVFLNKDTTVTSQTTHEDLSQVSHNTERPFLCDCPTCSESFLNKDDLDSHKQQVHEEMSFLCDKCPMSFAAEYLLNEHKASHTTKKPYLCDVPNCSKSYKNKNYLYHHKQLMHTEKHFRCDKCLKTFATKYLLDKHKVSHNTEKPYSCNVSNCSYSSKWKHSLYRHKRLMHT